MRGDEELVQSMGVPYRLLTVEWIFDGRRPQGMRTHARTKCSLSATQAWGPALDGMDPNVIDQLTASEVPRSRPTQIRDPVEGIADHAEEPRSLKSASRELVDLMGICCRGQR
jgi:hypothetical protein